MKVVFFFAEGGVGVLALCFGAQEASLPLGWSVLLVKCDALGCKLDEIRCSQRLQWR